MENQHRLKAHLGYRVPYAETDQMGMVYYANYLVYFERTRNEIIREVGLTYRDLEAMGYIMPVIEAHCDYRKPAEYDDWIDLYGWFEGFSPTRFKAFCEIYREGRLLAEGYTLHVCLQAQTRRPCKLPGELRRHLEQTLTRS